MTTPLQLKNLGIKHLKSYFILDSEKTLIQRKFDNISGKTGKYNVPDILWQKRTARKNRILIPFEHVVDSGLTYNQLNTIENGVTVDFVNNDFFKQLSLPEKNQNIIFKKLQSKLGSDENVSAIITIRSTGNSSSQTQREALLNLQNYLDERNLCIKDCLIKRKKDIIYTGQGNDKWQGFIYYNTTGGQQNGVDSHKKYKIPAKEVQLFNPSVEYASKKVSIDITLVMIYFALFSIQENRRGDVWKNLVNDYLNYFETIYYDGLSLKDYVNNHISLNLEKGKLIDPIQIEPIWINDFIIKGREENSLDITHQISVNRHWYTWNEKLGTLLTPARPTNLFWSKHLSNMMQQDYSLNEYFEHQREIIKKWDIFGINNLI